MALICRQEAAHFLTNAGYRISGATLAKQAVRGDGCPYSIWNGRAVYETEELLTWARNRLGPKLANSAERQR